MNLNQASQFCCDESGLPRSMRDPFRKLLAAEVLKLVPSLLQAPFSFSCLRRFPEFQRADSSSYQLGQGSDETHT